jgi:thymidine phosphorylase
MLVQEIIRAVRDGQDLADEDIAGFVAGLTDGRVSEGQAAAFAMAVFFRGLTPAGRVALTRAMARSGTVLDWRGRTLSGPVLDKHSTGGVGDTVSLILAPAIAACGGVVPMISGAGLGHTGGTLDKMESIPGYCIRPDLDRFARVAAGVGCAIIGQTADLAPADGRLYAVRDVTATVESLDLITASILSKKLAAGLDGLVMDVKVGNGAFMANLPAAGALARGIVEVATGAGLPTVALITDMNQVLGTTAGNALEVRVAIDALVGGAADPRLMGVTRALAVEMLRLGGLAADDDEAGRRFDRAISSGEAAERFARMVAGLGGPADLLDRPDACLAVAPVIREVWPVMTGVTGVTGVVGSVDVRALGLAVVALGAGRRVPGDRVDHAVGLSAVAAPGQRVGPAGQWPPLAVVHARTEADADAAAHAVARCFAVLPPDGALVPPRPLIDGRVAANGTANEGGGAWRAS